MWRLGACAALAALLPSVFPVNRYMSVALAFVAYISTGGWKWLSLTYRTLGRDLTLIKVMASVELSIKAWNKKKSLVGDIFGEQVAKHPDKKAFVSADTGASLTFKQADELANRVANTFYNAGYRKGDIVALIMENRIEYVPIWVGLSRIGVVSSLINFNLRGNSLRHCLEISKCRGVIFTTELQEGLKEIESEISKIEKYCFEAGPVEIDDVQYLESMLSEADTGLPPRPAGASLGDELLHIYTSGTTGLPKAAVIRGFRAMFMAGGVGAATRMTGDDILYNALPLYHSNGGLAIAANALRIGTTVVIKKKFSASRFFEDCCKNNVTVFNYIGETCRYLLATKPGEFDKKHNIRIATGNGLRKSIWKEFCDRFNVPLCMEFYGATEGNANMANTVGKIGSVGFNSVLFPFLFPIKLVRWDEDTETVLRGPNGLVIPCAPGETGMLIGKIRTNNMHRFDGYVDKAATKKKVICDVFKKGDSFFVTGDVLVQDEEGFFYFQDRTGDTFRWKGENVSTNQIEGVISKSLELSDVVVYGVEVPGVEGRAGMACIQDPERKVDLQELRGALDKSLAAYARPVFIRLADTIPVTATFKFQKTKLREQAFDPTACGEDNLYYYCNKAKTYLAIDGDTFKAITDKEIRF